MSEPKQRLRLHTDGKFDLWWPSEFGLQAGWKHAGFFAFKQCFVVNIRWRDQCSYQKWERNTA